MGQKLCRICGKLKELNEFPKQKNMADGHRNECKKCNTEIYYDKDKIRESNLKKEIKINGLKICRICEIEKDINEFHVKKGTPDGHRRECKECVKDIQKKYKDAPDFKEKKKEYDEKRYSEKKNKILERKKEYYQENKESILAYKKIYSSSDEFKERQKQWWEDNRDLQNNYQAKYREKYPHIIAWRSTLYSTLKRLGTVKEGHCIEMLGYSAIELKEHIEKQFKEGMTWENHGEWHIDHVKPVSSFDKDSSMSEVCSLANLQQLWATENLSKGNKTDQVS